MPKILLGTSGWMYKDWNAAFFPPDVKGTKQLPYYAQHFQTVEINATFYRMPAATVFTTWRKNTTTGFVFSVKLNQYLTHRKRLILDDESLPYLKTFIRNASALKEKFGALLIQLPPGQKENKDRLAKFLIEIQKQFSRRKYKPDIAIEFRHPSWFTEPVYSLLRRNRVALVIGHSKKFPSAKIFTAHFSYIRMHGPGVLFASKYSEKDIREWLNFMARQKNIKHFYVYFNNDYHANAIVNAQYLASLINTRSAHVLVP
jgi:uncharacterized protein YecE (DUF72 family)